MMKNAEIKRTIWESRFRQYEIAEEIGISEYTFCRWFRRELSEEQKEQILNAITALRANESNA